MRILLIEDDRRIAEFLLKGLREAGYAVDHSADGEEGLALALAEAYDAAVIDLMLPKRDGLNVIDALRARGSSLPVLILSAKRSLDDRVAGLQRGGDASFDRIHRRARPARRAPPGARSRVCPSCSLNGCIERSSETRSATA